MVTVVVARLFLFFVSWLVRCSCCFLFLLLSFTLVRRTRSTVRHHQPLGSLLVLVEVAAYYHAAGGAQQAVVVAHARAPSALA